MQSKHHMDNISAQTFARPLTICYGMRGWLVGWREIGEYCGFGGKKGTSASRTGRRLEGLYKLPVHRLPDKVPRAIPFELDAWLIEFSRIWKDVRPPDSKSTESGVDWRASGREGAVKSPSGVKIPGD